MEALRIQNGFTVRGKNVKLMYFINNRGDGDEIERDSGTDRIEQTYDSDI